jgi:hypothetical protein
MARHKTPVKISRKDERNADEFIREWARHVGSVAAAEREAKLYRGHLHLWLCDPSRRFSPEVTQKISRASGCPAEALMFRWTPIKDLDMWNLLEVAG